MSHTITIFDHCPDLDESNEDPASLALSFYKNPENWIPFSVGLTQLILKYSYIDDPDDVNSKTHFICNKLKAIGVSITPQTVEDWFTDKHRPAIASKSRTLMYQICFSLSVSLEDVKEFFRKVYFDKSFNCHKIDEAVYYYCFSNSYTYEHAQQLIEKIERFPINAQPKEPQIVYTKAIQERLNHYTTDEELLEFFKENRDAFLSWNKTSRSYIDHFTSTILGKASDKKIIKKIDADKATFPEEIKDCGLIIQELLFTYPDPQSFKTAIKGLNITSNDFLLSSILYHKEGLSKKINISPIVKENFPSKKTLSTIYTKSDTMTSYDSIRKYIILLKFYEFWCQVKIGRLEINAADLFDVYYDETNAILFECGYEELYARNPYDWIYLCASITEEPLYMFRDLISTIVNPEPPKPE